MRWIVVIALIAAGLFYWFQIRPAQLRNQCERYLKDQIVGQIGGRPNSYYNGIYRLCLTKYGMKAEDLF